MRGNQIIKEDYILLNFSADSKKDVIEKLIEPLLKEKIILDKNKFINDVYERENMNSTFAGDYLAIPHGNSNFIVRPVILIAKLNNEIIWDDQRNLVKLIVLFGIPENSKNNVGLEVLKKVAASLGDIEMVMDLLKANTKEKIIKMIYTAGNIENNA